MFTFPPIERLGDADASASPASRSPAQSRSPKKKSPKKKRTKRIKMSSRVRVNDPDPDKDGQVCGVRRSVPGVHCTCKHACKRARNRRVRIQHARAPWRSVLSEGRRTALWLTLSLSLRCLAVLSQARYCRGLGASRAVACVGDPR